MERKTIPDADSRCLLRGSYHDAALAPVPNRRLVSEDERAARRTARLLSLATALAGAGTTQAVADAVLARGLSALGAARGFFACIVDGRREVIASVEAGAVTARDAVTDEAVRVATFDFELPLFHGGSLIGCVGFGFAGATALRAVDRAFTGCMSELAAAALHRARASDAEAERRVDAEHAVRARADVLGVVAHDLRNPLSLIDMTAQFLLDVDPPADRRRAMLSTTRRAAAQMNRLIGDLVDDARIEAGRLVIEFGVVDVGALLRTAEERYRPIAEKRGVELRIGPLEGPIRIRGDELRILQALGNLLDNAVKFTPAGGTVVLEASATSTAVALSVSDTGPGIADSDASRVWDRFWQARKSDPKGVGLGLAIVRGIVEAHGGRVLLESKVGVGSIFALTLPRSRAASGEF